LNCIIITNNKLEEMPKETVEIYLMCYHGKTL